MANLPGSRIRSNNKFGAITDNPLAAGAVSFNSLDLANLPAVAGDHAIITLDPLRQYGNPEIVMVTAHTGAATVATIQRGMYGTTARSHPQGTFWTHAGATEDFITEVTSATRPADPYRGEVIFETDTNSFVARDTSDAWQTVVSLGAWAAYTPTLGNITLGNGTLVAAFARTGRTIYYRMKFTMGTTSAMGTSPTISLPVTAAAAYAAGVDLVGDGMLHDSGGADYPMSGRFLTSSTILIVSYLVSGANINHNTITATVPFTWGTADGFSLNGTYEAAS